MDEHVHSATSQHVVGQRRRTVLTYSLVIVHIL